jgi:hypothetical protein
MYINLIHKDERTRFVVVLEIPRLKSPETAVQIAIVADGKKSVNRGLSSSPRRFLPMFSLPKFSHPIPQSF